MSHFVFKNKQTELRRKNNKSKKNNNLIQNSKLF